MTVPVIGAKRVGTAHFVAPGSIIVKCADCQHEVWITPQSQNILAEAKQLDVPVDVVCLECVPGRSKEAESRSESTIITVSPAEFMAGAIIENAENQE